MTQDMDKPRWQAVITYRFDVGPVSVHYDIEEPAELADLVENGPDWNTIVDIRITLELKSDPHLTIEETNG